MIPWGEATSVVARLRDDPRSQEAWERFYHLFHPRIALVFHAHGLRDEESLKDLVQQVFFRFLRSSPWRSDGWKSLPEPPVILNYLRSIATNLWRDAVRSARIETVPLEQARDLPGGSEPPRELEWKEEASLLQRLTEDERRLLILRYHYDLPLSEIAERLGISVSAAGTRIHRLRRRLQLLKAGM